MNALHPYDVFPHPHPHPHPHQPHPNPNPQPHPHASNQIYITGCPINP